MLRFLYSIAYTLWAVVSLPTILYKKWWKKKNIHFLSKFLLPNFSLDPKNKILWLHAVSLGEMKAALWLIQELKKRKSFSLVISTQTSTGYHYAKSVFDGTVFFLPLDFYFLQKKLVNKIKPHVFILMESDFWLNQITALKEFGTKIFLINGKFSYRSFERVKKIPFFSKSLFSCFDLIVAQSEKMQTRFLHFVDQSKVIAKSNIKLLKTIPQVIGLFPVLKDSKLITVACTHPDEEMEIVEAIFPLLEEGFEIAIAPRHPERFETVFLEIKERYSGIEKLSSLKKSPLYLVDQMGVLNELYAQSSYVIMGGSYCSKKGGHDIFEPIMQGVFTFFGPYMQAQEELKELATQFQLGEMQEAKDLVKAIRGKEREQRDSFAVLKDFQKLKSTLIDSYESVLDSISKEM